MGAFKMSRHLKIKQNIFLYSKTDEIENSKLSNY
ncbi:MAG: hypothetical protein ACI8RP_000377 [Urechidicola sp.]|jgi:hypothetical protein